MRSERIELPTPSLGNLCSIQLSYERVDRRIAKEKALANVDEQTLKARNGELFGPTKASMRQGPPKLSLLRHLHKEEIGVNRRVFALGVENSGLKVEMGTRCPAGLADISDMLAL